MPCETPVHADPDLTPPASCDHSGPAPTALLITTAGVEAELLFPPLHRRPLGVPAPVHVAQVWRPITCYCGAVHSACERHALAIVVGPPASHPHIYRDALAIGIARPGAEGEGLEYPLILPHPGVDFGPWAAAVVRNAVECTVAAAAGFSFNRGDQARVICGYRRFGFVHVVGRLSPGELAKRALKDPGFDHSTPAAHVVVSVRPGTSLDEAGVAAACLTHAFQDNADVVICHDLAPEGIDSSVSLLFARG